MIPGEQFPTLLDVQQLEQAGFSSEEAARLLMLKARYLQGVYHEANPEEKRMEFARWLYTHGYLER